MNIYLAARYSRRLEMEEHAARLRALGHAITSSWIDGHHETRPDVEKDATPEEIQSWAIEDVRDMRQADTVILFTDDGGVRNRGGKDAEFGFFIGMNTRSMASWSKRRLIVVGPRTHVFTYLPEVEHYATWTDCLEAL